MWYIHTLGYCLAMKRKRILIQAATWMNLECIMLSEASHKRTNTVQVLLYKVLLLLLLSRFSCVQLCATLWTAVHQAPPSTGFSRQEYWSGLPFPSPLWGPREVKLIDTESRMGVYQRLGHREQGVVEVRQFQLWKKEKLWRSSWCFMKNVNVSNVTGMYTWNTLKWSFICVCIHGKVFRK